MIKIKYLHNDKTEYVDNNTAYTLISTGKAVLVKETKEMLPNVEKITKKIRIK